MIAAAILCAGRSLNETWPRRDVEPHVVIAVNYAGVLYDHDVFVSGDPVAYTWNLKTPRFEYFTQADLASGIKRGELGPQLADRFKQVLFGCWENLQTRRDIPGGFCTSHVAALAYALEVSGADIVDVYGHDASGVGLGAQGCEYDANRWQQEETRLAWLRERFPDVPVTYHRTSS